MKQWLCRPELYGIVLRLILLPLAAFWDLYGYYWLGHQWVYHGAIPFEWGGGLYAMLPNVHLHAAFLWVIKSLFGTGDIWGEMLYPSTDLTQAWVTADAIRSFYLQPYIHRTIFFLKLPYTIAEIILIRLLVRKGAVTARDKRTLNVFLWFNPASLVIIAFLGTSDIIPILITMFAFFLMERHKIWAGICFSCVLMLKTFPLLFFPFIVLLGAHGIFGRVKLSLALFIPVLIWMVLGESLGASMFATIFGLPHYDMATSAELSLHYSGDRLYLFVLAYVLLVCHAARLGERSVMSIMRYSAATLLLLFAFSFFHAHYFLWYMPFLALFVLSQRGLFGFFLLQCILLGVYMLQWGPIFTTYLLAPFNPDLFIGMTTPIEWMARFTDPGRVIGIAHSLFSGLSLWCIYLILNRKREIVYHS